MSIRFFGKNPNRKYVQPMTIRQLANYKFMNVQIAPQEAEDNEENKDIVMEDSKLEKIEKIMGEKAPKRPVKVEKKEKGLIERTENSTILLTEDNKMVLTD